jgi:hypothetical protein
MVIYAGFVFYSIIVKTAIPIQQPVQKAQPPPPKKVEGIYMMYCIYINAFLLILQRRRQRLSLIMMQVQK